MDDKLAKEIIAKRVGMELRDGDVVNLGIGLPTLVPQFLPSDISVTLQSENGIVGMKSTDVVHKDVINAGGAPVSVHEGGSFISSVDSFSMIRGGHIDVCVLGALEVDRYGNLANWCVPGKFVPGMGGAMDLVCGAKKVIVSMLHTSKGKSKILEKCTLPLTAAQAVHRIITELCVFDVTDKGLLLKELAEGMTVEQLQEITSAPFEVDENLRCMWIA